MGHETFPEFLRVHLFDLQKRPVEVGQVAKSRFKADFRNGLVAVEQEMTGFPDAKIVHVFDKTLECDPVKITAERLRVH